MKIGNIIIGLIVLVVIVGIVYFALSNKLLYQTSTIPSTGGTSAPTSTAIPSSLSTSIVVYPANAFNHTINVQQVITTLGTGWTSASQYNYVSPSSITLQNGSKENVAGYGVANFTNGGEFLATEWVQFENSSASLSYINSTFSSLYPNASNVTRGTLGNAAYIFYTGYSINGQAASIIYANDGQFGVTIFNQGTTFQLQQGKQLLAYQLSDLNVS